MSGCTPPDQAAFESGTARGVTPPLLPTLAMAVILGAASYLCHEPAAVAPPASVPATALAAAPEATAEAPFIPAPLAFQTQFPLVVAQAEPAIQARKAVARPARIAAPRRPEPPRVATKAPLAAEKTPQVFEKALPFVPEAEVSQAAAETDGGLLPAVALPDVTLPDVALPFAPTIRAFSRASAAAGAFVVDKSAAASAFVVDKSAAAGAFVGDKGVTLGVAVSGWVGRLR